MANQKSKTLSLTFIMLSVSVTIAGCNSLDPKQIIANSSTTSDPKIDPPKQTIANSSATSNSKIDLASFSKAALVKAPVEVDCTLTDGSAAKCAQIKVKYKPNNLKVGPFCPTTVKDAGGIWNWDGKNAGLYRIDGAFLKMLDSLGYKFYDTAGKVHVATDITSKPKFKNTCMSLKADKAVEMTILLPMTPKTADKPSELGTIAKVGLALDGVPIFADAPSVLKTGHMPALDTCGGHIDPGGWYHWHATSTDINSIYKQKKVNAKCALKQLPSAQFAYAFDGYKMYGTTEMDGKVPTNLDACHGHVGPTKTNPKGEYHYHATGTFPNLPSCLKGVQAKNNFSTTAKTGIGAPRGSGGGGGHDRPSGAPGGSPGGPGGGGPGGPGGGPPN